MGAGGGTIRDEDLLSQVPAISSAAEITVETIARTFSENLDVAAMVRIAEHVRGVADEAEGVVVTIGTDTLDEHAFALDVLLDLEIPLVLTGALRNPGLPSADGSGNLLNAIQVAASPAARGLGVLVVLNGEIHAARSVQKAHTYALNAFTSAPCGPIGWVVEDRPRIVYRPVARIACIALDSSRVIPYVGLATTFGGDDGRALAGYDRDDVAGLVIQTLGSGHVPERLVGSLALLAQKMPIAYASRVPFGDLFLNTYAYPGAEIDLLRRGLICAGAISGPKARALLAILLAADATREQIRQAFETLAESDMPARVP
jgi:L-asparaginase